MQAEDFITKYKLGPDSVDADALSEKMLKQCLAGLSSVDSTVPMIPAYLKVSGNVPCERSVIVIDAGGTNFRSALVEFGTDGAAVSHQKVTGMPGVNQSISWERFISFAADEVEPLLEYSRNIGFCFSYNAVVTPDIDARVVSIDKEVKIPDAEGHYVGASLTGEFEKRGYHGVRVFIINDTAAVLLGGYSGIDPKLYSGFVGQVSGTGTNTCCIIPSDRITKLSFNDNYPMLVNMESGMYDCMDRGELDIMLDEMTDSTGLKLFEKMTAGVYLGALCRIALRRAVDEEYLTAEEFDNILSLGDFNASIVDAWSAGNMLDRVSSDPAHCEFVQKICEAMLRRSAKLMTSNILAVSKLTGAGTDPELPMCVFAEGSLVQKSRTYLDYYGYLLSAYMKEGFGRHVRLVICNGSTLGGSAAAALLNS